MENWDFNVEDISESWLSSLEENIRAGKWQDSNGNLLSIKSMDTAHIISCQNLIKRKQLDINYAIFNEYLELFASELERRTHGNK